MGMLMLLILMGVECGIMKRVVKFTLLFASVDTEKLSVFLSTSNSPPHRLAKDSKVVVFHESKGRPLFESIL